MDGYQGEDPKGSQEVLLQADSKEAVHIAGDIGDLMWARETGFGILKKREAVVVPSWNRRGGRAIKTLERRGRGGQSRMTTPSALSKVASQHFLDAQPPLLS